MSEASEHGTGEAAESSNVRSTGERSGSSVQSPASDISRVLSPCGPTSSASTSCGAANVDGAGEFRQPHLSDRLLQADRHLLGALPAARVLHGERELGLQLL